MLPHRKGQLALINDDITMLEKCTQYIPVKVPRITVTQLIGFVWPLWMDVNLLNFLSGRW